MFQTHPVRMWMEYELPGFQKPLAILTFYLNPQKTIVPRIRGPPYEWSSYSLYGMGLEDPNATVQWTVACCRLDSSNTLVAVHSRTATQTSPFRRTPPYGQQQSLSHAVRVTAPFTQGSLCAVQYPRYRLLPFIPEPWNFCCGIDRRIFFLYY